jgi:hypothetical protein
MASAILLRAVPVEHVVLAGESVQSRRSVLRLTLERHAPRARFARWHLAALYSRLPLLGGLQP